MKKMPETKDNEVVSVVEWVRLGYLTLNEGLDYINNRTPFKPLAEKAMAKAALWAIHDKAIRRL